MKKVVFLGIFTLFSFFLFSQSPQTIEVTDIDGFQYLSYQSINDSIWGIRYYSRDKNEVVHVCKIKGSGDIANYKKIEFELSSLLNTQIPKIKCGIRKIKIGFVFSNVLYDEIRIISSDYQINNIKKFKKNQ
ncbi:MAG: hypothetical protein J0M29_10015 [Chitinophagales bacterium]|nr:hypothetical protein [Chitinophagales bacterium]